jgi:hypothetical protein
MNIRSLTKKIPQLEKARSYLRPARGLGFSGDGRQRLRSEQTDVLKKLTRNKQFVRQYPELLTCNEGRRSIAERIDVAAEIERYFLASKTEAHYPQINPTMKTWVDQRHGWGNLHPSHQAVVDACLKYRPVSVCDVGAGSGIVSKYVYAAAEKKPGITAVEYSPLHIEMIKDNFNKASQLMPPQMDVPGTIVRALAQDIPLPDASQELVFTCTVMMHQPFIAGVLAACEIARISSRYVLHVEGYHTAGIERGFRDRNNLLVPDFERLYRMLGFRTIQKEFHRDPYSTEYDYVVFLAERD